MLQYSLNNPNNNLINQPSLTNPSRPDTQSIKGSYRPDTQPSKAKSSFFIALLAIFIAFGLGLVGKLDYESELATQDYYSHITYDQQKGCYTLETP